MKKLRLSYSLMSVWSKGRIDDAVKLYLHQPLPTNKAMEDGKRIHKEIEEYIKSSKSLPPFFPKFELTAPLTEHKMLIPYNDRYDLSIVIDCLDAPSLYEFKTGTSESNNWIGTDQIPFYFLAMKHAGIEVEKAYLLHYNQYEKTSNWSMLWNGQEELEKATNLIESVAPEIYDYFSQNGLLQ